MYNTQKEQLRHSSECYNQRKFIIIHHNATSFYDDSYHCFHRYVQTDECAFRWQHKERELVLQPSEKLLLEKCHFTAAVMNDNAPEGSKYMRE
jgi:hypothetical protein